MPTKNQITHIVGTGTVSTQAGIDALTTIENFTLQSDQGGGAPPWASPRQDGTLVPRPAQIRRALNGNAIAVGLYTFQWVFDYWTFGMMDYWLDTFLTTSSARVWAKACSVRTYDDIDAAIYLNCMMNFPEATKTDYGWRDVIVRFDFGTLVTS